MSDQMMWAALVIQLLLNILLKLRIDLLKKNTGEVAGGLTNEVLALWDGVGESLRRIEVLEKEKDLK